MRSFLRVEFLASSVLIS